MSSKEGGECLFYYERKAALEAGVHDAFASHLGAAAERLNIISAHNVRIITPDGELGHMQVAVEWTDPQTNTWHWHSYRFNGENPVNLSEDHLTLLGKFACERDTVVNDYSRSFYGSKLPPTVAPIIEMVPAPVVPAPIHQTTAA